VTDSGNIETGRDTIFHSFKLDGVTFLAFPYGNGVTVLSENGDNYGSWMSEKSFRISYKTGKPFEATVLGKASISIRIEN
jgi:hypothetical protein